MGVASIAVGDVMAIVEPLWQSKPETGSRVRQRIESILDYAAARGCSSAQLALAWLLAQGPDILPIPGTKHRGRLQENIGALAIGLSTTETAEISALVSALGVHGERHPPAMMQVLNG